MTNSPATSNKTIATMKQQVSHVLTAFDRWVSEGTSDSIFGGLRDEAARSKLPREQIEVRLTGSCGRGWITDSSRGPAAATRIARCTGGAAGPAVRTLVEDGDRAARPRVSGVAQLIANQGDTHDDMRQGVHTFRGQINEVLAERYAATWRPLEKAVKDDAAAAARVAAQLEKLAAEMDLVLGPERMASLTAARKVVRRLASELAELRPWATALTKFRVDKAKRDSIAAWDAKAADRWATDEEAQAECDDLVAFCAPEPEKQAVTEFIRKLRNTDHAEIDRPWYFGQVARDANKAGDLPALRRAVVKALDDMDEQGREYVSYRGKAGTTWVPGRRDFQAWREARQPAALVGGGVVVTMDKPVDARGIKRMVATVAVPADVIPYAGSDSSRFELVESYRMDDARSMNLARGAADDVHDELVDDPGLCVHEVEMLQELLTRAIRTASC